MGRLCMARNVWFAVVGRCAAVSVHEDADATEMVHEMRWLRGRWSGLRSSSLGRDGADVSVGGALWSLEVEHPNVKEEQCSYC